MALREFVIDEVACSRGVVAVFTRDDFVQDGVAPISHGPLPRDDGGEAMVRPMPLFCDGMIRHLGEFLAMIVATDLASALDAAECIAMDTVETAPSGDIAFLRRYNDPDTVSKALDSVAHCSRCRLNCRA